MLSQKTLKALFLVCCLWMMTASSALQARQLERNFPVGVKRGKMTTTDLAQVVIDGKLRLLSPALRIYNEENAITPVAHVYVRNIIVFYLEDDVGEILKIWILTPEETKLPLPKAQ
ncbi:MAG: hypothetical protein E6Q34_02530 [Burkholderiaceae bacterium]|nr:MAG: hypothetical protein E6Q34_02530 [Burkholderiaceae bacterium]